MGGTTRSTAGKLKDTVRIYLDKASGLKCFSESQNSTVALTALLHFEDEPQVKFSFDVAIVARNAKGTLCRLVYRRSELRAASAQAKQKQPEKKMPERGKDTQGLD